MVMKAFAVSDVAPSTRPLAAVTLAAALAPRLGGAIDEEEFRRSMAEDRPPRSAVAIEASGANQDHLICAAGLGETTHPVLEAVHTAFSEHYPLVLSPDDVWLCVAQGFALHAEVNAEALRSRFVRHAGKLELAIRRDDFIKGSPDNDWPACFAGWSDAIAAHIGKKRDLVVASFSTTGPVERAASELVLMSSMKGYFDFLVSTMCGIPAVTLLGTVEDWRAIRRRAEVLAEFDLGRWTRVLLPVLDQLVAAAAGHADREFWRSIYKQSDESGGPYVTGWINVLFPYLVKPRLHERRLEKGIEPNHHAFAWPHDMDGELSGTTLGDFPQGLSQVPLTWEYLGEKLPMTLSGGFVGISQDPQTLAVRPAIGWAVSHAT